MDKNVKNSNTLIICGRGNVGKTTALILAMNEIIEYFNKLGANIDGPHKWGLGIDCWVRINYRGTIIGINTRGDKSDLILDGLKKLGKCDYYICASHLYGKTIDVFLNNQDYYGMKNIIFLNKVGLHEQSIDVKDSTLNVTTEIEDDNQLFKDQILNIFYNSIYKQ